MRYQQFPVPLAWRDQDDGVSVSRRGHADLALGRRGASGERKAGLSEVRTTGRPSVVADVAGQVVGLAVLLEGRLGVHKAVFRLDCAARSLADFVTPRKVGMAMASRMARINSTTMSSMRVKPASSPASPASLRLSLQALA